MPSVAVQILFALLLLSISLCFSSASVCYAGLLALRQASRCLRLSCCRTAAANALGALPPHAGTRLIALVTTDLELAHDGGALVA
jgi:hypothetical protein